MRYIYFLLLILFLGSSKFKAQIDTSFWFVAPNISSDLGDNPIKMHFTSYNAPTTVIIRQPANGTFTPISFTMAANSYTNTVLTASISGIENNVADVILPRGFWISSSSSVSVVYSIESGTNKEMLSLKGQKAIGIDFYTPFQNSWRSAIPSSTNAYNCSAIDIVATQNNTQLVLTPRANIIGHNKDVTFTKILQKGQTFSMQDTTALAPTKLAGSIISADKPVAITITSSGLRNAGCTSNVSDQITNSSYAGTDFVITRGNSGVDKVYILATVNATSVTATHTGTLGTMINTGETYTVDASLSPLTYIKTTKPVYVLHVTGFGCKLSGEQIPNFYCAGTYTTAFMRTAVDSFGLNLYTRNGFQSNFLLNGSAALVPASGFSVVPGTGGTIVGARFYYTTGQIPVGSYNTVTNSGDIFGCGVTEGKSNSGGSYYHVNDFLSYPDVNAGPATATICSNTSLSLNGYAGGGNVTGQWFTSGFGSFTSGTVALTNTYVPSPLDTAANLTPIKIVLQSTGPCPSRTDTIKVKVLPAPLVNASVDQVKCGNNGTVTLNGSVQGSTSSGAWSTLGCGSFVPSNTLLSTSYVPCSADTAAGSVKLVLISTNNGLCIAVTDTIKITYTKPPLVNAGPATATLCSNNPNLVLTGIVSGSSNTGKWTSSGTGVFTPNNISLNSTYVPSSADVTASTVTIRLQSTNNGLCFAVFDSIMVNFTTPPIVSAGVDLYSCKNSPAVALNGTVTGATNSGVWSGGTGTYNPNNTVLNATYTPSAAEATAGFVILTLTSSNNGNCLAVSDQVRIDFKDKPLANFNINPVCQDVASLFQDASSPIASGAFISGWDWRFGDGSTQTGTVSGTDKNPAHTYTLSGTYSATLIVRNSYGCYDTIQKPVIIYGLPNAAFGYSRSCAGTGLKINFSDSSTIAPPDTIVTYQWDYGGLGTSSLMNPSKTFTYAATYNIKHTVISNKGCQGTITKTVVITPRPKAGFFFSNNSGANIGTTVIFTDTSKNAAAWAWTFGDGNSSNIPSPTNVYFANGTYTVTQIVTDQFGCKDTARKTLSVINVETNFSNLIPNAISPNDDGKNDIWRLDFIQIFYPDAIVEIYNRWGEQIFYSHDGYKIAWDGTYKGKPLPVGTYFYVINLNSPKDEQNIYKGPILLVK